MMLPPLFMRLTLRFENWGLPSLWLPIVLLWPILFVLLFFVFVIGLVAILILETRSIGRFTEFSLGVYRVLCESRGTSVDVVDGPTKVLVSIV